jgi:hypothetical protein
MSRHPPYMQASLAACFLCTPRSQWPKHFRGRDGSTKTADCMPPFPEILVIELADASHM